MSERERVMAALEQWVLRQNAGATGAGLGPNTSLISERWITSLQITDLLLEIEELRGAPVDPQMLKPGSFTDLDTIASTFFPEVS